MQKINFLINGRNVKTVDFNFKQFNQLPISVQDKLFQTDHYEVKSNVESNVLTQFIDYLLDTQNFPSINSSTARQYNELCQEFGIANIQIDSNFLDKMHLSILCNDEKQISNYDKNTSEVYIAEKLDHFIKNYSQEMYHIPFSILYNIFYSPKRILNSQDKAYEFLSQTNREQADCNCNLFLLIGSLEAEKLKPETINECISKQSIHFNILPQIGESFVNSIINETKQKTIHEIQQENETKLKDIQQKYETKLKDMQQEYETKLKDIQEKYVTKIAELTSLLDSKISKLFPMT